MMRAWILASAVMLAVAAVGHAQDFGRRERFVDIIHYAIEVRPDLRNESLTGAETVELAPLRPALSWFELDAVGIGIDSVRGTAGTPLAFTCDSAHLRIFFPRPVPIGEHFSVRIAWHCTPRRGMYFTSQDPARPEETRVVWTQGQAEDTRFWVPCYDYPNDKATSEISIRIDSSLVTLGNGRLESRIVNGDGTATWHWVQDAPHSSYLMMMAAGRYDAFRDSADGIPVDSYYYPTDDTADVRRAYGTTARMVRFYADYIGVKYPWAKYAQIPVPDFMYGGMENTSATVLNDRRVVLDPRASVDQSPDALIAHELAHQWWGDLVTYADWQNGWLNEGFATFFQQLWTRENQGADEYEYQCVNGVANYLSWADAQGHVPLVTWRPNGPPNIYGKGAAVLRMLERQLGDTLFRRSLAAYCRKFAYDNVESNDLKRTIERVTGEPLQWFFEQWVYKGGYPVLDVSWNWVEGAGRIDISVRQTQARDSLCGLFRLPLDFDVVNGADVHRHTMDVSGTDSISTHSLRLDRRPDAVVFDPEGVICGRIVEHRDPAELEVVLRRSTAVPARLAAAAELAARIDEAAARRVLLGVACGDPFYGVRLRAVQALASCNPDSCAYAAELRDPLLALTRDVRSSVRATASNGLGRLRDRSLLPVFRALLADSSRYVEASAMNAMLAIDSVGSRDVLLARLMRRSSQDILAKAALDWLLAHGTPVPADSLAVLLRPGHAIDVRLEAIRVMFARKYFDELWTSLCAMLEEPDSGARMLAVSAIAAFPPAVAAPVLAARLAREHREAVKEAIRKGLDQLGKGK